MSKYLLLFAFVFAEQVGLPLPSVPFLLGAGAYSRSDEMTFAAALAVAVAASLLSDVIWYFIGQRRGSRVLNFLCRISLEPDSCVRRTEGVFERHGARSLLIAKFVPGLNTIAPPLAGIFQMGFRRFLLFDFLGALLWVSTFMSLGWIFSRQLAFIAEILTQAGGGLLAVMAFLTAGFMTFKYVQRRRFLRRLRIDRVTPEQLKAMIDAGDDVQVVDLRHSIDFEADPRTIPNALHIPVEDIRRRRPEIDRARDIVLYCT